MIYVLRVGSFFNYSVCKIQKLKSISLAWEKNDKRGLLKKTQKMVQLIFLINAFMRQIKNNKYYL